MFDPDLWAQGRGTITAISTKGKGLNISGQGYGRYFSCPQEMLVGFKVGQAVKFKCSMTYNEFEKAWRPGEIFSLTAEAPGAAAKAS